MTKDTSMSAEEEESMFSDEELFDNDSKDCIVTLTSSVSYEDEYQSLLFQNRDRIITKLKNDLSNFLPPPPTVTTCRLSLDNILDRWYQYQNSNSQTNKFEPKELKNIDRAKKWSWPEVVNVQCFDVYYNIDNKSVEMALLEMKYQQRYVSNETQSLMNTGHTPQPKKERGLITQVKPLEQNIRIMRRKPVSKPQILAEAKAKLALVENKRRILVPGKLKRENITKPLEKSYLENSNSIRSTAHKRALFQSPEINRSRKRFCYNQNPDSDESSGPLSAVSICSDTSNTTPVKRWSAVSRSTQLFKDELQEERKNNIPRTEPIKKCQRALKFFSNSEKATPKNLFNTTKSNPKELSKLHKQVCMLHNVTNFAHNLINNFILF
ncbi:Hypothetical protein CINCED_3A007400 [Cinara cedri]|uniref:Uncharacterized protein n=1 Tax=Cinara cedri TaxID=506608 RepID=A0A5E4MGJ9_9HEMI|nr:Hypothetical protein CINCED_3A007400 [Cinara cedri]